MALTFYVARLGETLGAGPTACMTRLQPGTLVKCPRASWWVSEAVNTSPFINVIQAVP